MKVIIFFYSVSIARCDLEQLRQPGVRYVLIATEHTLLRWEQGRKNFFDDIVDVHEMVVSETLPVVRRYIDQYGKDQVTLITSDEDSIPVVAALRRDLDLPGNKPEQVRHFIDKVAMKESLQGSSVRMPHYNEFNRGAYMEDPQKFMHRLEKKLGYPMIVKPTDLFGSAGVARLNNHDEFEEWSELGLESELNFVFEEFIEGKLFHCDALILKGKVVHTEVSEYTFPCDTFSKGFPLGSFRLDYEDPRWQGLADFNREAVLAMDAPDGATHLEVFEKSNGELVFLEVGARPAGANVIQQYALGLGLNYELAHFQIRLNLSVDLEIDSSRDYYAWAYFPKMAGKIKQLSAPVFESHHQVTWHVSEGEVIPERHLAENEVIFNANEVAGMLVIHGPDYDALYRDFELLRQWPFIEYESR